MKTHQQDQSNVLRELSSMIVHILKSPPPIATSSLSSSPRSPTAFASLFMGISLALMLFGSVSFAIGFVLIPVVTGLVLFYYALEILFTVSRFGRSILCSDSSSMDFPGSSSRQ